METRELTCIGCPMGCAITVTMENGEVTEVTGNTCNIGNEYARKEVTHPSRIVTSTVRVKNGSAPVVSVKTQNDIPKDQIFNIMRAIQQIEMEAPVAIGDVVCTDICGTGVDLVATRGVM